MYSNKTCLRHLSELLIVNISKIFARIIKPAIRFFIKFSQVQ